MEDVNETMFSTNEVPDKIKVIKKRKNINIILMH